MNKEIFKTFVIVGLVFILCLTYTFIMVSCRYRRYDLLEYLKAKKNNDTVITNNLLTV
jgi:hypothetical protein